MELLSIYSLQIAQRPKESNLCRYLSSSILARSSRCNLSSSSAFSLASAAACRTIPRILYACTCRPFIYAAYSALTYGPYIGRFGLAPNGVYLATDVAVCAAGSYPAISPLPLRAVSFLLHFPSNGDIAPPSRTFVRRSALGVRKFLRFFAAVCRPAYIFYNTFILIRKS